MILLRVCKRVELKTLHRTQTPDLWALDLPNRSYQRYNDHIYRFSSDAGAFVPQKIRSAVRALRKLSRAASGDERAPVMFHFLIQ